MKLNFKALAALSGAICLASWPEVAISQSVERAAETRPPFTLSVVCGKPEAIYAKGAKVKFLVSVYDLSKKLVPGKRLGLSLTEGMEKMDGRVLESKDSPVAYGAFFNKPGFILCGASLEYEPGRKLNALAGAAIAPLEISPAIPEPEDFKEFWDVQKAELGGSLPDAVMLEIPPQAPFKGKVETFDVSADCPGGAPIRGYYSRPAKAAPKSLPALVCFQEAGVRSSGRLDWRAAQGMIAMDINAHGVENGKPESFYRALEKGALKDYRKRDANSREKTYFHGMLLRALRALEFMKSQPEWDGRTLIVWGAGQGGAQALAAAALDSQVSCCVAIVPAFCDMGAPLAGRKAGWPDLLSFANGKANDLEMAKALSYYDMTNFAPYVEGHCIFVADFIDSVCPPDGIYAAYNRLKCQKEILNYPLGRKSSEKEANDKLLAYLKMAKADAKAK